MASNGEANMSIFAFDYYTHYCFWHAFERGVDEIVNNSIHVEFAVRPRLRRHQYVWTAQ